MPPVNNIPLITNDSSTIPFIQVNGTGVELIQTIRPTNTTIRPIGIGVIADARVFMNDTPTVVPPVVPVTEVIGTPVVNMPGCVKVHKENVKQRSRNKMLVDDDPKGNTVLCDAGAPYYEPADYDYRGLSWQTIWTDSEEAPEGIDTGDPPAPEIPDAPSPPETPGETAGKVEPHEHQIPQPQWVNPNSSTSSVPSEVPSQPDSDLSEQASVPEQIKQGRFFPSLSLPWQRPSLSEVSPPSKGDLLGVWQVGQMKSQPEQ